MKILVVGGAGYLGGAITDILQQQKEDFLVYDNLLYEETYRKPVPFEYGDVRNYPHLLKHLKWADTIIWIAALVGDQACALNQSLTKEINSDSVEFLKNNFNGRIIFTSTCSVYGISDKVVDETSNLYPQSLYAETKIIAEKHLENQNALILRLGTLFGVSDYYSRIRSDLVVNTLTMHTHAKNKITIFGGEQYRPVIHVKDIAKIIYDNLTTNKTGIYNVHKENISILDIAKIIKKYFLHAIVEITNTKFEDNRNYQVSSEKAKEKLSFNPTITINEGVLELKQLLDEKRIVNPFNERYNNYQYLNNLFKI